MWERIHQTSWSVPWSKMQLKVMNCNFIKNWINIIPASGEKFKWIRKDVLRITNTLACLNQKEVLGPNCRWVKTTKAELVNSLYSNCNKNINTQKLFLSLNSSSSKIFFLVSLKNEIVMIVFSIWEIFSHFYQPQLKL